MSDLASEMSESGPTGHELPPNHERFASSEPIVWGVATNIAGGLGVDVRLARVGFLLLGLASGWGCALYLVAFILLRGRILAKRAELLRYNLGLIVAIAVQFLLVGDRPLSAPPGLLWPALLVTSAFILSSRLPTASGSALARVVAGVILMGAGFAAALAGTEDLSSLWRTGAAVLVLVGGVAIIAAPSYLRSVEESEHQRRAIIRAEERSDVAAHLHDSVLQTLTLIQNRASEPEIAAALARQQERELRRWLYQDSDGVDGGESSFRRLLEDEAARVEDQYLKIIECVVVGDRAVTSDVQSVVAAAAEAMVNAAKFAETPMISVFAEVTTSSMKVFVRDRGVGFDPAGVPDDRLGLSKSIRGRIERLGGAVAVKSSIGDGTEIRIEHVG